MIFRLSHMESLCWMIANLSLSTEKISFKIKREELLAQELDWEFLSSILVLLELEKEFMFCLLKVDIQTSVMLINKVENISHSWKKKQDILTLALKDHFVVQLFQICLGILHRNSHNYLMLIKNQLLRKLSINAEKK